MKIHVSVYPLSLRIYSPHIIIIIIVTNDKDNMKWQKIPPHSCYPSLVLVGV